MFTRIFKRKLSSKAQAMVEFALTLPILLLIIIGVFEAGRLLFYYVAVNTASRDAARYGATVGTNGGVPHYYDCATITQIAQSRGFIATINNVTIGYDHGPQANGVNPATFGNCAAQHSLADGDRIVVTAEAVFTPIVKEIGGIRIFNDITVRSTSYRTIMSRTYLPQQISYGGGSSSSSGGSSSSSGGSSSSSGGSGGSSSSSGKVLCQTNVQYLTNSNSTVHNVAISNPSGATSGAYTITELKIVNATGQAISGTVTKVTINGNSATILPGVAPVTIVSSWPLSTGQSLSMQITFSAKNQSKNFNVVVTKASGAQCEIPLP